MRPLPAPCRALRVLPALLFLAMPHAGGRSPDAVAGRGLGVDVSFGSLLSPARRELAVGPPSCRTHGQSEVLWTDPHRSMGLAFTLGHRSGSVVGFAPRGSLRLRGGAEDESDMTYPFFAVREQPGRSERVLSLLRQNMTDAEILSHPTLRGHCITSEILVSARKEWDGDGKSVREVEQRLNEVTMASARRVRGNATEDEIRRWRAKAVRAFDERDGKTHGRDDAPDEGAGEGGWEQGTPLTKDTLPAYMAANAHRFEAQVDDAATAGERRKAAGEEGDAPGFPRSPSPSEEDQSRRMMPASPSASSPFTPEEEEEEEGGGGGPMTPEEEDGEEGGGEVTGRELVNTEDSDPLGLGDMTDFELPVHLLPL
ncbi:hypothetical protein T484DRAFT_1880203, partial [Baffinella frigidus]